MKDINDVAVQISQEMGAKLYKYLPPKLAYRFRKWLQSMGGSRFKGKVPEHQVAQMLAQKAEELILTNSLKKSEALASFYDHGVIKMDFGSEVSEKARKAAMAWAKKKGLKAVEASLNKSSASPQYTVFAPTNYARTGEELCISRAKLSFK